MGQSRTGNGSAEPLAGPDPDREIWKGLNRTRTSQGCCRDQGARPEEKAVYLPPVSRRLHVRLDRLMEVDERGIRRHVNGLDALQAPDLFLFPSDELRDSLGVGRALHDNRPVSLSCNMHTVTECAVVLAREEVLEVLDDLVGTPFAHLKRHGAPRVESTRQRGDYKIQWVAPQDRPRHRLAADWDRSHERLRLRVLRGSQQ